MLLLVPLQQLKDVKELKIWAILLRFIYQFIHSEICQLYKMLWKCSSSYVKQKVFYGFYFSSSGERFDVFAMDVFNTGNYWILIY